MPGRRATVEPAFPDPSNRCTRHPPFPDRSNHRSVFDGKAIQNAKKGGRGGGGGEGRSRGAQRVVREEHGARPAHFDPAELGVGLVIEAHDMTVLRREDAGRAQDFLMEGKGLQSFDGNGATSGWGLTKLLVYRLVSPLLDNSSARTFQRCRQRREYQARSPRNGSTPRTPSSSRPRAADRLGPISSPAPKAGAVLGRRVSVARTLLTLPLKKQPHVRSACTASTDIVTPPPPARGAGASDERATMVAASLLLRRRPH
ncbi:hypothetical protein BDK51DRAFT_38516 [Blyttiomyces helicus]|uniref:Uncharacterized protein n=1 Tax=Blyttiomyces helicus TaxID=388810 RepID=A0A4P9W893_9FUNG|nr:hypothetical protein BDK51DRAFT_38516 [Blyttiomyces helicus]|eukprot:RKO87288.1 hypothetical protein BDK51DRAFT_38516 [Blyttiomyces helicus]